MVLFSGRAQRADGEVTFLVKPLKKFIWSYTRARFQFSRVKSGEKERAHSASSLLLQGWMISLLFLPKILGDEIDLSDVQERLVTI